MNWIKQWLTRRQLESDAVEDMQAHLDEAVEELMAGGMSRKDALLAARRRFGNVTLLSERSREVWRWALLEQLWSDARYALRQLRRAPAFTVASVLTLALGIGANTAVFSVVDAVMLQPLPFADPGRLVSVESRSTRGGPHPEDLSYPTFFDFRSANHVFDHLVCYRDEGFGLSGSGEPVSLRGLIVSWDLFPALGIQPALGRGFLPEEEKRGQHVAILGYELWRDRFGASPSIVGREIAIDRHAYTVVGVAPAGFNFPIGSRRVQIWTTLAADAGSATSTPVTEQRGARMLAGIGLLRKGVTLERAQAEMDGIAANLARAYPNTNKSVAGTYVRPAIETIVGKARDPLLILLGAVGLVLLIACANVANLLLARTAERQREFAVRASIGAGRGRLVRQLLAESITFSLLGSLAGVLAAKISLPLLGRLAGDSIPRLGLAGIDGTVLAFSILLAFATSVIIGLAPAWRAARIDLASALKEGSRTMAVGDRLRSALVVVQVALGVVLLSGAGLLTAGLLHLTQRDPGFSTQGLLTFGVGLPNSWQGAKYLDFYRQMTERLNALPGVQSVASAMPLPLTGNQMDISFDIEERPAAAYDRPSSDIALVSPEYFETAGIPLLEGRGFTERDDAKSPPVLIVNRAFADRFFPGERVLGKRLQPGATADGVRKGMREIVGVVGNARQDPLGTAPDPIYYYAAKQLPWCCGSVIVRSPGNPLALESSVRRVISSIDSQVPVIDVRTLEDVFSTETARPRFQTFLAGGFAAIALLLTSVGLYGILAHSVLRRTREIGIRVALGAARSTVAAMVVREAVVIVAAGLAIGIAGAAAGNRGAARLAYGAGVPQPVLVGLACCVILSTAILAAWIPARRAASIHPMQALRND